MSLICRLFFISAKYNFTINITHIAGADNYIADALSPPDEKISLSCTNHFLARNTTPQRNLEHLEIQLIYLQSQAIGQSSCETYAQGHSSYNSFRANFNISQYLHLFATFFSLSESMSCIHLIITHQPNFFVESWVHPWVISWDYSKVDIQSIRDTIKGIDLVFQFMGLGSKKTTTTIFP